jgi:hypothetical protein
VPEIVISSGAFEVSPKDRGGGMRLVVCVVAGLLSVPSIVAAQHEGHSEQGGHDAQGGGAAHAKMAMAAAPLEVPASREGSGIRAAL